MSIKPHQNEGVLNEVGQPEFELQVKAILRKIAEGQIEKVVLARSESHSWPVRLHPVDFVERLCIDYPQAFVNLVLHPVWGLWIGATPELLLEMEPIEINNPASSEPQPLRRLRSMALAGTLPVEGNTDDWGEKEKREQQVVDDYIAQSWKTRIRNFHRSERSSIYAGPVQHLRTLLEGESNLPLDELVGQLHPTPAVGGWPKDASLNVLSEIERGSRQLYGGFMGPVESPDEARLFVNLRTLQIRGARAHLHIGCGILGGSEPTSEWEETVYKSKTLLRHLYSEKPKGIQSVD
jgi:isochorismate synthase